jgi:hypothetical protein
MHAHAHNAVWIPFSQRLNARRVAGSIGSYRQVALKYPGEGSRVMQYSM